MVDYGWPLSTMFDNHWIWLTMVDHCFQRLTKDDYGGNMGKWLLLVQVALWHPIVWLCGITMLVKVHVALWHPTMILSQCDIHCRVPRKNIFVTLRHSWKLRLKSDNHLYVCLIVMLNNNYARLWCSLVGLSHYNIHNGQCQITTWKICLIVHVDLNRILCKIVTLIISHDTLWYT